MTFLETLAFLGIIITLFVVTAGLVWVVSEIIFFFQKKKQAKKEKQYPEFYAWVNELNAIADEAISYHNTFISPLKREVDTLRKQMEYLPKDVKILKLADIEALCAEIYHAEQHYKTQYEEPMKELRERIKEYNNIHKVEKYWE